MVLGCYYLTVDNPEAPEVNDRYFASLEDALVAYDRGIIGLHSKIWVRYSGPMELGKGEKESEPQIVEEPGGTRLKITNYRRIREDQEGNVISQYIRTTPGRIIFNKTVQDILLA
jgi:DNA-directed RNA polymerase subunit beta'